MKAVLYWMLLAGGAMLMSGCYQTHVRAQKAQGAGEVHEVRQWFTAGGLAPISSAAGSECGSSGMSYVQSGQSGLDVLALVGLSVLGGLIAPTACDDVLDVSYSKRSGCHSIIGLVPAFIIAPRTVKYECAR